MSTANPMKSYRRYKGGHPRNRGRRILTAFFALVLAVLLVFCALLGIVISGSHDEISGEPQMMVVLGCQVLPSGEPSVLLKNRLDTAATYLESHPDVNVIVSGGKGTNEVLSEAQSMKNYLIGLGIAEERIWLEDKATSTYENLLYSMEMIESEEYDLSKGVLVVSNGFHLARTRMLWNRIFGGDSDLSTLAAPCGHFGSMIWMHVREPLVFAKDFLARR